MSKSTKEKTVQKTDKSEKNKKKRVIFISAAAAAVVAAIVILLVFGGFFDGYDQKMSAAQQCMANGDYDNAISCYRAAIDAAPKREEPYIALADLYYNTLREQEKAIEVLQEGYLETKSEKISDLLLQYMQYNLELIDKIDAFIGEATSDEAAI